MRMRIRMEELPNENENGISFSQNHFSTSAASSDILENILEYESARDSLYFQRYSRKIRTAQIEGGA